MNLVLKVVAYYVALIGAALWLVASFPAALDFLSISGPVGASPQLVSDVFSAAPDSRLEGTSARSALALFVSMVGALLLMIPISWTYMGTRRQRGFDQSVVQTIMLLPIAVAGIVIVVQNSLALAFSLAGIVAGVRFRNTLKDTADALYVFTAIGVGLAAGIGALGIAAVLSLFFSGSNLALWIADYGNDGGVADRLRREERLRKQTDKRDTPSDTCRQP